MDNPQPPALPKTPKRNLELKPPQTPPSTNDHVWGCGCLSIIVLALVLTLKSCFFSSSSVEVSEEEAPDFEGTEAVSEVSSNAWLRLDKGRRKAMAEQKYQEAEKLSAEMDHLLEQMSNGQASANVIGRYSLWKTNVASLLKEVEQTECHLSFSSKSTAMGKVHSALENMTFASNALEKFAAASTAQDRNTYASMHANHSRLVKECLRESREWMTEGEF